MSKLPIKERSLMFAPMEGVTDIAYREVINDLYPQWDTYATDFLRATSGAPYPTKHILKHYGKSAYQNLDVRNKTIYQVLTAQNALTEEICQQINDLEFPWLDINLGCPSKTVVKRHGGSFILSDTNLLKEIIGKVRQNFSGTLTAKIRVGFKDDALFSENLKVIEDMGFDGIIIHARTREQLYKGRANWDYIKQAVEQTNIPIIGNGDVWTTQDIDEIFKYTNCHSTMVARGALKSPWLAKLWKANKKDSPANRIIEMKNYFDQLNLSYEEYGYPTTKILKRFKGLSRYMFDDFEDAEHFKTMALRSLSLETFFQVIASIKS
ncbi:tRNA-dihydrouridine synthase family protein [Bacteriovoracaceae bacterium]|nr:tRNA-dihydrouridine synthase family protein [Bacteriovoracaceae bacterium]